MCVSDARYRAVARAAPPLASLRQAIAALGKSDLDASPHPNALAFGLASELSPPEEAREYV